MHNEAKKALETDFISGSHSNNDDNSVGDVITGHMKVCGREMGYDVTREPQL